jgi:hypothetical protein
MIQDRKRAIQATLVRKESITLPVIPSLGKEKSAIDQSKKLPSDIFTAIGYCSACHS